MGGGADRLIPTAPRRCAIPTHACSPGAHRSRGDGSRWVRLWLPPPVVVATELFLGGSAFRLPSVGVPWTPRHRRAFRPQAGVVAAGSTLLRCPRGVDTDFAGREVVGEECVAVDGGSLERWEGSSETVLVVLAVDCVCFPREHHRSSAAEQAGSSATLCHAVYIVPGGGSTRDATTTVGEGVGKRSEGDGLKYQGKWPCSPLSCSITTAAAQYCRSG